MPYKYKCIHISFISETYPNYSLSTFSTLRSKETFVIIFTIDLPVQFDKAHIHQLTLALVTGETIGAP